MVLNSSYVSQSSLVSMSMYLMAWCFISFLLVTCVQLRMYWRLSKKRQSSLGLVGLNCGVVLSLCIGIGIGVAVGAAVVANVEAIFTWFAGGDPVDDGFCSKIDD